MFMPEHYTSVDLKTLGFEPYQNKISFFLFKIFGKFMKFLIVSHKLKFMEDFIGILQKLYVQLHVVIFIRYCLYMQYYWSIIRKTKRSLCLLQYFIFNGYEVLKSGSLCCIRENGYYKLSTNFRLHNFPINTKSKTSSHNK